MLKPEPNITSEDLAEIAHAVAGPGELRAVLQLLSGAAVAKFTHFVTDGPGYCGDLFLVVWPAGPEVVDVLTRDKRGVLVANQSLDAVIPTDLWGEDSRFPRTDWSYEVQNNDTNLGYWDWVASMRAACVSGSQQ
jgi:hypothetical protein